MQKTRKLGVRLPNTRLLTMMVGYQRRHQTGNMIWSMQWLVLLNRRKRPVTLGAREVFVLAILY